MFGLHKADLSDIVNVLADGGYSRKKFANSTKSILGCSVEIAKRNELYTFKVMSKRWIVTRSFAWLKKCRRLWKNCERKISASFQMAFLSFLNLILKRF